MQSHHRIGPFVVAGPETSVVVRAGASSWNENEIALHIHGHDGPSIGGARLPICILAIVWVRRRGIEDRNPTPPQNPGAGIKGSHDTCRHGDALVVINR